MTSKSSKIIADLRKVKDWSQIELAANSGVSHEMISKMTVAKLYPLLINLNKLQIHLMCL